MPVVRRVLVLVSLLLLALLAGCEKPRDRACRALVLQADDAEAARTYVAPAPRLDAYRAESAARWIRATEVADADLKADASALADALDRLAGARLRLASGMETFGAKDVPELVMRAHACIENACPSLGAAQEIASAVTERGRADADITRLVASLRSKCGGAQSGRGGTIGPP